MPVLKVGARRVHLFGSSRGGWYPDAEVARFLAQSRRLESRRTVDSFFNRPTGINDGELTGIESPDTDRGPAVPLDEVVRQGWPGVKITHRGNPRKREREKESWNDGASCKTRHRRSLNKDRDGPMRKNA